MSTNALNRLLRPKSIAVVGGGAWCEAVVQRCLDAKFEGPVWPVHPKRDQISGVATFRSVHDLPGAPDATFIGVNRNATIDVVRALNTKGACGAVCFASGFREAEDGQMLDVSLLEAAGDVAILGPNCYGFINALDGAMLWPDVHGLKPVGRGVAIIGQSSNVLLNLTMQKRGLPIAYMIAAGNQAQQGMADIGRSLLDDDRVTALGFHIEGFGDIRAFEAFAEAAHEARTPVVAIKVGRSDAARAATLSHTASLAGADAGADALLRRLGFARADTLPEFLALLTHAHVFGPKRVQTLASLSCSGGEASLAADAAEGHGLSFPSLSEMQAKRLSEHLGPLVTKSNPLDYHTDIWRNLDALKAVFATMTGPEIDMTCLILDFPRDDVCDSADWLVTFNAIIAAGAETRAPFALVASLPENMPEEIATRAILDGIAPFHGIEEAMACFGKTQTWHAPVTTPVLLSDLPIGTRQLQEYDAKHALQSHGLTIPRCGRAASSGEAAVLALEIGFSVVLKGEGFAHKSEMGAVVLNLSSEEEVCAAADRMNAESYLVEEMIAGAAVELLVGVVHDPAHGYVLTLGAGGTLTEILDDKASLLVPASRDAVREALASLKVFPLLDGYRGKAGADFTKVLDAIDAIQSYVTENVGSVAEVEVNPLIVTADDAVAADALIVRN
ncbi:MAG: acetate--CoA ligase family protein [Pseudomonadota bacterium]